MQEHQQDAGQADRRETASNQNEDLAVPFERSTGKIKVIAQFEIKGELNYYEIRERNSLKNRICIWKIRRF